MSPYEPGTWSAWTWFLHVFGVWYLWRFFACYFRFRRLERAAQGGDADAVEAFNASLRGFPRNGFAKMMGKRPLEVDPLDRSVR